MGVEIRLPNITGKTEREQLLQLKSYLYQLSEQLQWAFDNVSMAGGSTSSAPVVNQAVRPASSGVTSANAEVSFAALKSLIIKSADIVDAYYDEINRRIESIYVSQSDFGAFAEKTTLDIEANSTAITQRYGDVQAIIREVYANHDSDILGLGVRIDETNVDVGNLGEGLDDANRRIDSTEDTLQDTKDELNGSIQGLATSLSNTEKLLESAKAQLKGSIDDLEFDLAGLMQIVIGVTAYIKSGLLYYTDAGVPVYGIEIGQEVESNGEKVFNKFSRFTSEKLSFYDSNGNEVAYISDKKLYIGQAEITISFKVGGLIDLVMANGDVVTKWEGGNG